MIFKYLRLEGFKRFPLRDENVFEYTFNSKLLMILGPNGSGKSSLFNELSPLPSDKNNFYKDGYKEIHIEKENKLYRLISDFRNGTSYSFLIDDEEQNLSNNITTQRELVFRHFNITQTIHELLIGTENFTEMSLLNRKKLFSSITHLNIDKILESYNNLKEELKNNELLLKTNTSLIQSEEQKLANSNHLNNLKRTQESTKSFIDFLLDFRSELIRYKTTTNVDKAYTIFVDCKNKIQSIIDKYYLPIVSYPAKDLNNYRTNYSSQLNLTNYKLSEAYSELETKEQEIKALSLTNQLNIDNLQIRLNQITESIKLTKEGLYFFKNPENLTDSIRSDVYKIEATLPDLLREIPVNENKKYSKEKYETLINDKKEKLDFISNLASKEISLTKDIEHLTNHNDNVTCPNCEHTWSLKDTKTTLTKLNEELSSLLKQKLSLQESIKNIDKEIEELINYFNLYKQYSIIRNSTLNTLKAFWEEVDSNQYIFNSPIRINYKLKLLNIDIVSIENINNLQKEKDEIEKSINTISSLKNTNSNEVNRYIEELNDYIINKQIEKNNLLETLSVIQKLTSIYEYLNSLQKTLEASRIDLLDTNVSTTVQELLNVIDSDLSKYKVILIETEKELHQYSSIQYTIDKYQKQIEDIQSNIKVLNIILEELSPKNGLIAKSVSSFLNIIINNINTTIASIWDYKMVLKAINVDSDVLNYKFKVEVEDKLPIEDINKVSNGMKEIINLSFKMILYKLLGLENYPVWLDEFGVKLDKNHRSKVFDLIFKMMNSSMYSQIFMITHLDMSYSLFKNVDILEL